ncbi:CDP-diacylglycerol--glycerol-3-phosphate 3-phosphatidyltransferase [Lentilactobacillus laojiaonis]|uniref:CDP-diacylglycerol--glycerol-3-phosphate 3-phosphatidyltransferase n=1 Tax=Lentilactobacillus laojiaonis TaxID=2883998 RepID=UPI001D09CA14|nr:CDP-diacylglycerol--glycerol-3-phosphate 3-phosphatidyltransferase [Lentilactobacillus laojiaonis]UDM31720.1 CDP-diacylglycerol--glycerol-3-phosphate 3-phosphatidyltransferase [Lentilactobacillus laojiaonis]
MNLPNKLTVFRIILIPFFILILSVPTALGSVEFGGITVSVVRIIATIIFIIASLTDFLDGQIARRGHFITNFGKFADPLADKMLVMTAFIFLVSMGVVPAWVASIIVCRELAVTGLRLLIVENDGKVLAAAWPGKIKTTTQMLSIILLLLNNPYFNLINIPMGQILLYVCLFFTIYSGIDYFIKNRSIFSDSF